MNRASLFLGLNKVTLLSLAVVAALAGCHAKEEAEQEKIEAERKFVSTPVNWVSDKMDSAGVKLGSTREQLLDFIKQENYRVCVSNQAYVHAVVPNSKIHRGSRTSTSSARSTTPTALSPISRCKLRFSASPI
jgi:hypothetical protein